MYVATMLGGWKRLVLQKMIKKKRLPRLNGMKQHKKEFDVKMAQSADEVVCVNRNKKKWNGMYT
jgi:hypothetical protein